MNNDWLKEWSKSKVDLALCLNSGECGGSYAEAAIILSNILSAISSDIWPGRRIDKNRFVELLLKYTDSKESCEIVSIPLLISAIRKRGNIELADSLAMKFIPFSNTRVITGDDSDLLLRR